jgi:hypothetical protein
MEPPKTWETKHAELEAAFWKVTPGNRCSIGIPYETSIPGIARELLIIAPRKILSDGELKELNEIRRVEGLPRLGRRLQKKDAAKKSLNGLKSASGRLVEVLDQLSPDVLDALNFERSALATLHTNVRILNVVAEQAVVNGICNAPKKTQPHKIA